MFDVFVYFVKLPEGLKEMIAPCSDGSYTIYLDENLDPWSREKAYNHAVEHITNNDFCKCDVQQIEWEAHHGTF